MADQQEELKLVVTLVDQATAGLEKINEEVAKLGGGKASQAAQRFKRENDEVTAAVKKMTGGMGEAFESLGMMRLGFAGGAAGLALFGFEMMRQINGLKEYTDKLRGFGAAARKIGADASELKNLTDQFKNVGVEANTVIASVGKVADAIADLQRPNSKLRKELMESAGGDTEAMNRYIDSLKTARTWADRLNIIREAGENVYRNKLRETGDEVRAQSARRMFYEKQGYDVALDALTKIQNMTEEQRRWEKERIDNATAYSSKVDEVAGKWAKIAGMFKDAAISGWLGAATDKINNLLDSYIKMLETQKREEENLRKKYGPEPGITEPGKWFSETEQARAREAERLKQEKFRSAYERGEGLAAWVDKLLGIWKPDALKKATEDNTDASKAGKCAIEGGTDATKDLTDTLKQLMNFQGGGGGGDGVGGGGFQYASLGMQPTARGGPVRFGSREYPAIADPGGDPRGGGARRRGGGVDTGGGRALEPPGPRRPVQPAGKPGAPDDVAALKKAAGDLGITPEELATVMSYETVGTMSPKIWGGTGGNYLGLIQFGAAERRKYGVHPGQTFAEQTESARRFLTDRGLKKWLEGNPNATEAERRTALYSTINAGSPGRRHWGKSDRPGHTVASHARDMFAPGSRHAARAKGFLGGDATADRQQLDQAVAAETKVNGTGHITVDVNAPRGTRVGGSADGLFKHIEINRQIQMDPAARGPSFEDLAAMR